ncbi:MAG: hypothetical protein EA377_11560 [Phycisphaerales bacterium]|nr:MAG: hypothetical protein EA377_11560 [Phycisphaerales bacterium]
MRRRVPRKGGIFMSNIPGRRGWLLGVMIAVFVSVPMVFAASGLLSHELRRIEQAQAAHEREVERAWERFVSQVERANQQLERQYDQVIRGAESRGETGDAEELRRELKERQKDAFRGLAGKSSGKATENDGPKTSNDDDSPEDHGHEQLIRAVGPVLYRITGEEVDSRTLAQREYVMLYFSAQWCAPCRTFTPDLIEFYRNQGGGDRFEIILISRDGSEQAMVEYARESGMP